jgi:hypothetical protein
MEILCCLIFKALATFTFEVIWACMEELFYYFLLFLSKVTGLLRCPAFTDFGKLYLSRKVSILFIKQRLFKVYQVL